MKYEPQNCLSYFKNGRSSRPEVFCKLHTEAVVCRCYRKKVFLEISQNSQEKTCPRASILIKFQKNRLWHRCFPVKFAKFSRTTFCYRRLPVAASGMYMYRGLETYIFIWLWCWTCFEKVIKWRHNSVKTMLKH